MFKALVSQRPIRNLALLVYAVMPGIAPCAAAQPSPSFEQHVLNRAKFPTPAAHHPTTGQLFVGIGGDVRIMRSADVRETDRLFAGGDNTVLRLRVDAQRQRLWVLDIGSVHVFDLLNNRPIKTVPLRNWVYAADGTNCLPDLQLDAHGAAYVSDNLQPKLWRIDGETLDISERTVSLSPATDVDVGFSALFIGENGVVLAAMGAAGLLWRVDADLSRAEQIPLTSPIHGACAIETLSPVRTQDFTVFVLQAAPRGFDVKRVEMVSGASTASVAQVPLGSTDAAAGMLSSGGTLHFALPATLPNRGAAKVEALALRPIYTIE